MQTPYELTDDELAEMAGIPRREAPPQHPDKLPGTQELPAAKPASLSHIQQPAPAPGQRSANDQIPEKKANILIVGPSGSGKSTSLRNLDPERTIILSTENKAMPFKGGRKFKKLMHVQSFAQFQRVFARALTAPGSDVLVVDSLTSLAEFAYNELVRHVEKKGDNVMAAWARYKDVMRDILLLSKQSEDKYVVFIGIDTFIQDEQQRIIRTTDIQGSLKGKIEKEFLCVLWTKVIESGMDEEQSYRHVFITNSDTSNKAKTPMGMFENQHIDNDVAAVIARCESYATED